MKRGGNDLCVIKTIFKEFDRVWVRLAFCMFIYSLLPEDGDGG